MAVGTIGLRKEAIESMWELVDRNVKDIALNRKASELFMDIDNETFDAKLNELCSKWHDKFAEMKEGELMAFMMADILETIERGAE